MKLIKYVSIIFCSILIFGCNGGSGSSTNTAHSSINNNLNTKGQIYTDMGAGFDTLTQSISDPDMHCLKNASDPNSVNISSFRPVLTFDHQQTLQSIEQLFGAYTSESFTGGRYSKDMNAEFINQAKNTSVSTKLLYVYQYSGRATFKNGALGRGVSALESFAASYIESPTDFRYFCGNSYISQMEIGATVNIKISLNFNTHYDQERFNQVLESDIALESLPLIISNISKKLNIPVNVIIDGNQYGGDSFDFEFAYFPLGSVQCANGFDSSNACSQLIESLIVYPQNLPSQVVDSQGQPISTKVGVNLNEQESGYDSLYIPVESAPDPAPIILSAMLQLNNQYDNIIFHDNFIKHYTDKLKIKLSAGLEDTLEQISAKLENQEGVFTSSAINEYCFTGYIRSNCLGIRDSIENNLGEYQLTSFESSTLNYLENTSYSGQLVNYFGGSTPQPSDYRLSLAECVFAPIDFQGENKFAISCNGEWLTTANVYGVTIESSSNDLQISDLAYTQNSQHITYKDMLLESDPKNRNYFYNESVTVTAPNFQTSSESIGITYHNDNQG